MKPRHRVLQLLIILAALACARDTHAQDLLTARVDRLFAKWDNASSPGCALGIVRDRKLVYERGYGLADLDHDLPITPQTVFYVASMSKQFTATAIQMLADDGLLSLDDDVRKYIPELPVYDRPIKIGNLIHHTSGIRDYLTLMGLAGAHFEDVHTESEILDLLSRQRGLNFQPGEDYVYSNSGYFLLAVVVKRVSGKSLREFAGERIFLPLGMRNSHYHDDRTMLVKHRAIGYSPMGNGWAINHLFNFEEVGDGGVMTTVEDLYHWDANFYNDSLGSRGLVSRLLRKGSLNNGDSLTYASGLTLGNYRGLPIVSHGGGLVGFRTELLRFPEQHFSVILLCNDAEVNPTQLTRDIADVYLESGFPKGPNNVVSEPEPKTKFVKLPLDTLRKRAGAYRNPETGAVWRLTERNGAMFATVSGTTFPIGPLSSSKFRSVLEPPHVEFRFEKPKKGFPVQVRVTQDDQPAERLEAVTLDNPTTAQLSEYVGEYSSDELGVTYSVALWDDRLVARVKDGQIRTLTPLTHDQFAADIWQLVFTRDAGSTVNGFLLDAGRVWNIRFDKRVRSPDVAAPGRTSSQ
jgi:CubicO group peptidase (beta-lactamase class C family)